jgi:hypothetical protein
VSGSVAAIKVPQIATLLADFAEVEIIATDASRKLMDDEELAGLGVPIKGDDMDFQAEPNA